MALNAYLTLKGQKQGEIRGPVTQKGREGSILVHAFSSAVVSPRDAASGLPTGRRQHQPLMVVKDVDRSTPLLWSALVNNETLTLFKLDFYARSADATEKLSYTIQLTNANIASMRESMADNELMANAALPLRDELTFSYQKITWTWADGGIMAQDDWERPVV